MANNVTTTDCCIVGGGPAGVMLALLLARRGTRVTLLEAHADFDRDFRGDTLHPSTLEILDQIGLADRLLELPHSRVESLELETPVGTFRPVDFRGLRTRFPYVALMPQARFLEFLAEEGRKLPTFDLRTSANVRELIREGDRVRGVRYQTSDDVVEVRAEVTVACDGRHSRLQREAGVRPVSLGAPMDVAWIRVPREEGEPATRFTARIGGGHMLVVLPRVDQDQLGFVILKGSFHELRERGLPALRETIAELAPPLKDRVARIEDWKQVVPLTVESNRLKCWHRPGLLFIGDAAHAMSPVGGVGINYAIQDAVVAANHIARARESGEVTERDLAAIQRARMWPTRVIQTFQTQLQNRLIRVALDPHAKFHMPWFLRLPGLRSLPARLIGFGVRRVPVDV